MKIMHRILLVGFVPLLAFFIIVGVNLSQVLKEHATFSAMGKNIHLFRATSTLIGHLQRERGGTALFLAGGSELIQVQEFRQKTDAALPEFMQTLAQSVLPDKAKQEQDEIAARLKQMRAGYSQPQPELRPRQIAEYTALIQGLTTMQGLVPNGPTARGLGKILGSLMILEVAKESAGQLRANGSSLLALNAPLSNDQFSLIVRLKSEVDIGLSSPALVLSQDSTTKLRSLPETKPWKEVENILRVLLLKAQSGGFDIPGSTFFQQITQKIDDMDQVIVDESSRLDKRLETEQANLTRTLTISFGLMAVLAVCAIVVTVFFSFNIVRRINMVVASLKDIAEGDGDLTARLSEGKDELRSAVQILQYLCTAIAKYDGRDPVQRRVSGPDQHTDGLAFRPGFHRRDRYGAAFIHCLRRGRADERQHVVRGDEHGTNLHQSDHGGFSRRGDEHHHH